MSANATTSANNSATASNSSARTIAGYRLVAGIGKGGMARVYLAIARKAGGFTKLLVLKVLRPELDEEGDFVAMFLQEAKIAARLNHPNVVQTYEVTEDAGRHIIAMEYLDGQAFSTILTRVGRKAMPLAVYLRVLCDVLDGLHYAHELTDYDGQPLRIVHRDLSPQNIFVTYTGQAKLLDFGIAKVAGATRTQQGVLKGKVGYMAPEQAMGRAIDRRADLYAMGVLLWEGISGRRFVERQEDEVAVLTRRITGSDPMIRVVSPEAQAELADICDRAMAADANKRFATASEMREAIEAFMNKTPSLGADARRVAALLEDHFADDRTRIRKLIDEQIKSADETEQMINLETGATVTPPSHADVDVLMTEATQSPVSHTRSRRAVVVVTALVAVAALAGGAALFRRGGFNASATNATAGNTGAATTAATTTTTAPSSSSPDNASSSSAAAAASPAAPTNLTVSIRTVPTTATVLLDGKPMPNPHHVEVPKDGSSHTLQVTANGYAPDKKTLVYDHDHDVVVTLTRVGGAVAAPAQPTTFNPDVDLTGVKSKRPKRTVDDKDPYK